MAILRTVALICFFGPLSAMLFEPFFAELLDRAGLDTEDLAGPFMSFVSENTAWLVGLMSAGAGVWVHYFAQKFLKPKQKPKDQMAVRGRYSARLKVVVDPGSGKLRRTENVNVARFFNTGGRSGDYLFLAFEKPVGSDVISFRHNDGAQLLFEVVDTSETTIVLQYVSPLNSSGFVFECGNDNDLMQPTIGADHLPQLPEGLEKEKQH